MAPIGPYLPRPLSAPLIEVILNYLDARREQWTTAAELSGLLQMETFP